MSNSLGEDYWQRHVRRCIESGSTQAAYCRQHGLVIHQFGYWFRKLNSKSDANWLPVVIEQPVSSGSINLSLRGDRVLQIESGFDVELLKQVIVAVETTP